MQHSKVAGIHSPQRIETDVLNVLRKVMVMQVLLGVMEWVTRTLIVSLRRLDFRSRLCSVQVINPSVIDKVGL